MADTTCKDCKVERGYRPMLDYVSLCPLHEAAAELLKALRISAEYAHKRGGYHAGSFDYCTKRECIAAREAIRKAEGK